MGDKVFFLLVMVFMGAFCLRGSRMAANLPHSPPNPKVVVVVRVIAGYVAIAAAIDLGKAFGFLPQQ